MRLIPISDEEYEVIKKNIAIPSSINHSLTMKILANDNNIFFPDNATNEDVIKAMFSKEQSDFIISRILDGNEGNKWRNAPYQKGGNVE